MNKNEKLLPFSPLDVSNKKANMNVSCFGSSGPGPGSWDEIDCNTLNNNHSSQYYRHHPSPSPPPHGGSRGDPKSILEAEKAMTKELYEMSMEERENALHDVHGVNEYTIEETPDFVRHKLELLDMELQSTKYHQNSNGESYQLALKQNSDYVRGLYIMFLRCELFDVRLAAERICRHFDFKRNLWGDHTLGRDITIQEDFTEADKECLESGFLQILPQRDRAGRVIMVKIWYEQTFRERINVWRTIWYLEMTILQDELTQKLGKVTVLYNVTDDWIKCFDPILFKGVGKLKKATPVRTAATHYCFSDPSFGAIIKFVSTVMDRQQRTRSKLHQGTHLEVQYDLLSYGIGAANTALPLSSDGAMRRKKHLKWIKSRYQYEEQQRRQEQQQHQPAAGAYNTKSTTVLIPYHTDVLFGQGKMLQMHLGNMKLNHMLEEECSRYFSAKRDDKAGIALEIVLRMKQEFGTRFLKQQQQSGGIDGLWMEVDDKLAASKVGHGFRNRKPEPSSSTTTTTVPSSRSRSEGQKNKKRKQ